MTSKQLQLFLLGFLLVAAVNCCSYLQMGSASTKSNAYYYLARVANQSRKSTDIPTDTASTGKPLLKESQGSNLSKSKVELGFLVSYETTKSSSSFDQAMRDVAFTYDNALAVLAFIAAGDQQRAKQVADTLVYAQNHDRFYHDGRLRNAYRGGKLVSWAGNVELPGWYDAKKGRWLEDQFQVSTDTGNVAWAMLALLGYYKTFGGNQYLVATERMGEWIEANCRNTQTPAGGYTGGLTGWEQHQNRLTYKSTEHNLDLYAAFERLYLITGNQVWRERATHAKNFVLAMWDDAEGKFWTGTGTDGATIFRDVVPLDIQPWALLALKDIGKPYWRSLEYAQKHLRVGKGFDYNQDRDGIWYEGTAQMAVGYKFTGQVEKEKTLISTLKAAEDASGGLPAADRDGLTTGFALPDGSPRFYFKRLYVGGTAWLVLAEKGVNPFWLGSKEAGVAESEKL